jgi:hypothetical protein
LRSLFCLHCRCCCCCRSIAKKRKQTLRKNGVFLFNGSREGPRGGWWKRKLSCIMLGKRRPRHRRSTLVLSLEGTKIYRPRPAEERIKMQIHAVSLWHLNPIFSPFHPRSHPSTPPHSSTDIRANDAREK